MKFALAITLVCGLLAGCAAGPPLYVGADAQPRNQTDSGGVAGSFVYSAGVTDEEYGSYRIWISRVGGQQNCAFLTLFAGDPKTFEINDGKFLGHSFYSQLK